MLSGTGQSIKRLLLVARDLKKRVMDRAGKNDGEFTILKKERSYSHVVVCSQIWNSVEQSEQVDEGTYLEDV